MPTSHALSDSVVYLHYIRTYVRAMNRDKVREWKMLSTWITFCGNQLMRKSQNETGTMWVCACESECVCDECNLMQMTWKCGLYDKFHDYWIVVAVAVAAVVVQLSYLFKPRASISVCVCVWLKCTGIIANFRNVRSFCPFGVWNKMHRHGYMPSCMNVCDVIEFCECCLSRSQ